MPKSYMIKKRCKYGLIIGLLLGIIASVFCFQFYKFSKRPFSIPDSGHVLVIPPGTSVQKISHQLSAAGLMRSSHWFLLYIRIHGAWNTLKAGEYFIKPGTTLRGLIDQLQAGRVIQHALTIVPGWNFEQLLLAINDDPHITHTLLGLTTEEIMARLNHPGEHPEGRFFPETYYFPAGTTDIAFLQRAYGLLQIKLASVWDKHYPSLPLQSAYEALILASIIEKESSEADEYAEIAGVYIRRLEKKMPLQADPTVIYGIGKSFLGKLNTTQLKKITPYNTYQKIGLPPTPIALPSLKALEASVNPKAGQALYFVAKANGKGHVFSNTLQEHNVAVIQYRKSLSGVK